MTMHRPPGHCDALPNPAATPEPLPIKGTGDVWSEIIDTLPQGALRDACIARRQMGIDKYGQPLQRGDGRNHAVDEAQEYLDAAVYRAARLGADDPGVALVLNMSAECLGIEGVDVSKSAIPVVYHPHYQRPKFDAVLLLTEELSGEVLPVPMWPIVRIDSYVDDGCRVSWARSNLL